jgi:hypothetical protein
MIMDKDEEVSIPSVDEFSPEYLDELQRYIILDRRTRTSHSNSRIKWHHPSHPPRLGYTTFKPTLGIISLSYTFLINKDA